MNVTDFLSSGNYVILPTKKRPKVYLCFRNNEVLSNAIKLYNPFTIKAKMLKEFSEFLVKFVRPLASLLFIVEYSGNSEFTDYLNRIFNRQFNISLYKSTESDKVVLQLQDENAQIFGYLKYPISEVGKSRILNEINAVLSLSEKDIIPELLYKGNYKDHPFIILKNLNGKISTLEDNRYQNVLKKLHKDDVYTLVDHPRIYNISLQLKELGLLDFHNQLNELVLNSKSKYKEVYEHGDFAPWNLIQTDNEIIPFDFEYYVENGLEYLDEIKYWFQINHLLNGLIGEDLINSLRTKITNFEFDILFKVFLFKEIVNKTKLNKSIVLETTLLNML